MTNDERWFVASRLRTAHEYYDEPIQALKATLRLWDDSTWLEIFSALADLLEMDALNNPLTTKETQMSCFTDECFVLLHCELVASIEFSSATTIDGVYCSLDHALQECKDRNLVVGQMTNDGVSFEPIVDGNTKLYYHIIKSNLF